MLFMKKKTTLIHIFLTGPGQASGSIEAHTTSYNMKLAVPLVLSIRMMCIKIIRQTLQERQNRIT